MAAFAHPMPGLRSGTSTATGVNTPGVKSFAFGRPVAAEVRFGRAPILPVASMQHAADVVFSKIPACRNYFGLEGKRPRSGHLAEIR